MTMREKVCAVIGLARAGIPAARFLANRGGRVLGFDDSALEKLSDEACALTRIGVEIHAKGHAYQGLEECSLIVLSPGLKLHHEPLRSVLASCEKRGAEVIGELELAARHCRAPMIAVTGTKGKSTTVKLIEEMLRASGVHALRAGNTGTPLISMLDDLTPESWAVVEVSSFQLERAPTFKPRIAVLLNLLRDHQDYHPTIEQYWETKLKLFANQNKGDTAIINDDDAGAHEYSCGEWKREMEDRGVHVISSAGAKPSSAGVKAGFLGHQVEEGFAAFLPASQIPLRGKHNVANVACALASVFAALGKDEAVRNSEKIADAIRHFESLPHRLEIVGEVDGVTYVNDSQATIPDATIGALRSFSPPLSLVCGGHAKLEGESDFDALGQAVKEHAALLLTIGRDAARIEDAARRAGMEESRIVSCGDLSNAMRIAREKTPRGGTVLLSPACASFDQFTSFEQRGETFRRLVADLREENART